MDPEKLKKYRFKRGKGCLHCRETGYIGRIGVFEVMPLSDKIRRLITSGAGSPDMFKAAREEGMRTLREAAIEKVFRGITTTTEMVRVTGS
jgi:type II secretory ATPase GspE/PulE/Tfp pilus assembly ATPase PilB-like protein